MEELQNARQIAMQAQQSAVARDKIRFDLRAKDLKIGIGDKVWVLFPNVGKGKSKKLAFRMHGTYVVKSFLHGAKRVARLGHVDDEADEIVVHVDRMVKKSELPVELQERWKPIRLDLVRDGQQQQAQEPKQHKGAAKVESVARVAARENKQLQKVLDKVDPDTVKELEKALDDEDYRIEKILDHMEEQDGTVCYKVRFVGYGPKDDLWYDDADLLETAPEMVAEYQEQVEAKAAMLTGRSRTRGRRGGKKVQD
jgi:polyribonucleotide nucleotidyltransferase